MANKTKQRINNVEKIKLTEDSFGYYVDSNGKTHTIQRFTWKNHNNIEVQVITFGARITSLKLPNSKGVVDDVAMGFDDVAGYLYYDYLYMGATIGRTTDKIKDGLLVLNDKQYWLTKNDNEHHFNGGTNGFDKTVWIPHVQGTQLILSNIFPDLNEGYPGDVFVRIRFELTTKNEFVIEMEAVSTKPTILNMSNLLYFNLGGHGAGEDDLYQHIVSINANCFLPMQENGSFPTGDIMNVIFTKNDFQIPLVLNQVLRTEPEDGYNLHLCVNRGMDQGNCFVARAVHPPSGRMLEMYSNQRGMYFSTANHLGYGVIIEPDCFKCKCEEDDSVFNLIHKMHAHVAQAMSLDNITDYSELKRLIRRVYQKEITIGIDSGEEEEPQENGDLVLQEESEPEDKEEYWFNPIEIKYLEGMLAATDEVTDTSGLKNVIRRVLNVAHINNDIEVPQRKQSLNERSEIREEEKQNEINKLKEDAEMRRKGMLRPQNRIPLFYQDGRIHGKNNAIYKRHGAICFQSENYPYAINNQKFPSCELRPGEMYKHTIVYKFWLQSGNCHKWIKRNSPAKKA